MNAREALTARIRFKREYKDRLQSRLLEVTSELNGLIAQRDALTAESEAQIDALRSGGVVRIED